MHKPLVSLTLAAAILSLMGSSPLYLPAAYAADKAPAPKLVLNGEVLSLPEPPRPINDTYYAPARVYFEKTGYTVTWDEAEETLTAAKPGSVITLKPGSGVLSVNRLVVLIDSPPAMLDGAVWIPLRTLSEALGAEVKWNALTRTIFVKPGLISLITDLLSVDTSKLKYEGEMKDGLRDGKGKLFLDGMIWYEGEFSRDHPEGTGRIYDKEQLVYEGSLKDGRPDGRGTLILPNGNKYAGDFSGGRQTGEGELYTGGKLVYRGQWTNGIMEGHGDFFDVKGMKIYSGAVSNNERNGFGVAYNEEGKKVYDGQWSGGVREGHGQAYGADGVLAYYGQWKNDKQDGPGQAFQLATLDWVSTDKEKVTGTESRETVTITETRYKDGVLISQGNKLSYWGEKSGDGLPNGKGTLAYLKEKNATQKGVVHTYVTIYEGDFQYGKKTGYGKMYDDSGQFLYEGQLVDGIRQGEGQAFEHGLLVYDGQWNNDLAQGTGRKYTYEPGGLNVSSARAVVSIQEGDFDKGQLAAPGKIFKYFGPLENGRANGTGYTVLMYDPLSDTKPSLPLSDSYMGTLLYEGQFKDGYREGTGRLYNDTQLVYEGEFKKGLREGVGKEYTEDSVYTGPFANDRKNGIGKIAEISAPEEVRFEGEFRDGVKEGHGKEYYIGGHLKYEGEYRNNQRNGYGQLFHNNGVIYYQGMFRDGEPADSFYSEP